MRTKIALPVGTSVTFLSARGAQCQKLWLALGTVVKERASEGIWFRTGLPLGLPADGEWHLLHGEMELLWSRGSESGFLEGLERAGLSPCGAEADLWVCAAQELGSFLSGSFILPPKAQLLQRAQGESWWPERECNCAGAAR